MATLTYRRTTVEIPDVLVDTGAASTVINADLAADAGIYLEATDQLRRLRGVGGHETCSCGTSIGLRSEVTASMDSTSSSRSARVRAGGGLDPQ